MPGPAAADDGYLLLGAMAVVWAVGWPAVDDFVDGIEGDGWVGESYGLEGRCDEV